MQRRSGSQKWELMQEKERLARRLLAQGLTVQQITTQLRCSGSFVRRVRKESEGARASRVHSLILDDDFNLRVLD